MNTTLPVSLILTTLNEEAAVAAFFASVAAGTRLPAEIVVCDGGSTDGTVEALRAAAIDGPDVRILVEEGATIARGRNTAIRHSSFDILAVSDAGCTLDPHWLERITEPLLQDESVQAVSGGYIIAGTAGFRRCAAAAEMPVANRPKESFIPSSRSFAVRKTAFLEAGGYPEHLSFAGEDTALCLRMRAMGMRFTLRLDAEVAWAPRGSLSAFIKQHWLYGVGDGEAGINGARYGKIAAKLLFLAALAILIGFVPFAAIAAVLLLVAYFIRLRPKYEWQKQPFRVALCAFVLIFVKDWTSLAGYIKGALFRPATKAAAR